MLKNYINSNFWHKTRNRQPTAVLLRHLVAVFRSGFLPENIISGVPAHQDKGLPGQKCIIALSQYYTASWVG